LQQKRHHRYLIAATRYEQPMTHFINQIKFNRHLTAANACSWTLSQKIEAFYQDKPLPECIVPVPLHPSRLKERGFNQALEIAKPIAQVLNKPLFIDYCERTKATDAQAMIDKNKRFQNMKDAFSINRDRKARSVAIIDDVVTTGATIASLSHTLKQSGVTHIDVWCVARTINNRK
jgi:ComF family protein